MSDVNETPENSAQIPVEPVAETQPIQPAEPRAKIGMKDQHTAKNTPMQDYTAPLAQAIREATEEDRSRGYLSIFLGNTKKDIEHANDLLGLWMAWRTSDSFLKEGEISQSQAETRKQEYFEFLEQHYPNKTHEEMNEYCSKLFSFIQDLQDGIKVRSKVIRGDGLTNAHLRGYDGETPVILADIHAKKPGRNTAKFTLAEAMRRTALSASKDDYHFEVLLRNSFTNLTFRRPNALEIGSLIQDISREVKGYVRTLNNNSITLAYVAGVRVVWNFLANRIVDSSLKDSNDFKELASTIRLTDAGPLMMALVRSLYTHGVNLELHCLQQNCGWSGMDVVDADKLVIDRKYLDTPEESAVYGNIANGVMRYSREDVEKLIKNTSFGLDKDTTRIYSSNSRFYFELAAPTLQQAFDTFDYFVSRINPKIQELRANTVSEKEFDEGLAVLMASVTSSEYVHWISSYVALPPEGVDEEPYVVKRSEHPADEFNQGLMDILDDDPKIGQQLVNYVMNKTPFMSKTFIGVAHYNCPKCRTNTAEVDQINMGYTPIDPFMAFFTLAQLMIIQTASQMSSATEKALSQ